jgi:thymidylate kinase
MRTTALVGVDGTGKSTVARRLAERGGIAVLHAIRPHEDPSSPDADLSRALCAASAAADRSGRAQLKVAVLYLQLCLYVPAERRSDAPLLLADRHPLVDPLVYLPLYARIGADEQDRGDVARWWDGLPPDAAGPVRDWLVDRTGGTDPWALGNDLLRLARKPLPELLSDVRGLLGVALPQTVVLLDLPIEEALARTAGRGDRAGELHETAAVLTAVRARYELVLGWLAEQPRGVRVHTVDCAGAPVEEVARAVAAAVPGGATLAAPAPAAATLAAAASSRRT